MGDQAGPEVQGEPTGTSRGPQLSCAMQLAGQGMFLAKPGHTSSRWPISDKESCT